MFKIAIITAQIGNSDCQELTFSTECVNDFKKYGIDVFRFNNNNLDELKTYFEPTIPKEQIFKGTKFYKLRNWFTDNLIYKQKICPSKDDNYSRLIAKIPKITFYKLVPQNYDYYIWLDSKFIIYNHWLDYVLWLINKYPDNDIITSSHSERKTIQQELDLMNEQILKYKTKSFLTKYNLLEIDQQVKLYLKSPKFIDDKLYELTMIIYSSKILGKTDFLDEWYAHNFFFSIQDQLSFPYLCKKYNIDVIGIKQDVFNMPFTKHEYGL